MPMYSYYFYEFTLPLLYWVFYQVQYINLILLFNLTIRTWAVYINSDYKSDADQL